MAQLALGVVGAYLGGAAATAAGYAAGASVIFGMTGNAIGWSIGSLVGSMLGQKGVHNVQPGIGDKSVQASTYGTYKTTIYGTMRVAGNVIDGVSEVREVLTTTRVGKGGPKGSNTTRSWNADVAIDLCQAGIQGIRKIWADGKLVYDVSTGASASSIIASSVKAQSLKLYDGSESQLPDPTLEAVHGTGNVPAYRGRSYVVFSGIDCPNGKLQQLTFEVSMSISASATLPALTPAVQMNPDVMYEAANYTNISRVCGPESAYHMTANSGGGGFFGYRWSAQGFEYGNGYAKKLWARELASYGTGNYARLAGANGSYKAPFAVRSALLVNGDHATTNTLVHINLLNGEETIVNTFTPGTLAYDLAVAEVAYDEISDKFVVVGDGSGGRTYEKANPGIYTKTGGLLIRLATLNAGVGYPVAFYNSIVYVIDIRSGYAYLQSYNAATGAFISEVGPGPLSLDVTTAAPAVDIPSGVTTYGWLTQISSHSGGVFVYSKSLNKSWRVEDSWYEISNTVPNSAAPAQGVANSWAGQDYVVEGPLTSSVDALLTYRVAPHKSFDVSDVTLDTVVSDICINAGLAVDQIDVTGLSAQTLRGYAITRQSSARAALEPLMKAYFVDAREQDGKVQFVLRSAQTSQTSITFDELAAYESGDPPDAMPLSRSGEMELPRSVSVSYIDYDFDYQTGTQVARRQTVETVNDTSDDLAIATTANRAATVADVLLYDAWSQRNKRTMSLQRKYAALSPGDVVTVEYPQGTNTLKRITRANDTGVLISLDVVDGDAPLYDAQGTGVSGSAGQAGPTLTPPTKLALLDIPLLRDSDATDNGIFAALAGYAGGWGGGVLYSGISEATLAIVGSVTTGANIGTATTALGAWTQNTVDWLNSVTVEEVGTLSSCTLDAALDNGENACVIGSEVLQYLTATYVSAGKYVLSNLIRGQRGTEQHRGTHTTYENFVALPSAGTGLIKVDQDLGEVGQSHQYRAVSFGLTADSASSVSFTSGGVCLKPFSPVNFKRVAINGNSNLSWDRRSRLSGGFVDGGDIAIGEVAELYYVDIYSDSTYTLIVRTIQTNTTSCIYTVAQQAIDWGGYRRQIYIRISQVSALIGRGFPLEVDSNVANIVGTAPGLLAHFDTPGLTPVDSSSYAFPCAVTGAAVITSTKSKFGGSSLYIPSGGINYVSFDTSSTPFNVGTGDFTCEFWLLVNSTGFGGYFLTISDSGPPTTISGSMIGLQITQSSKAIRVETYGPGAVFETANTVAAAYTATNVWFHVALVRRSGALQLFIDGFSKLSVASTAALNYSVGNKVRVGGYPSASVSEMYYDEFLFVREARYAGNFTPPTSPH
jgi:hypothetical protein